MTIFDNYEVWFVIGSQHLYGPETLRQVTQHAEHVVNALNTEACRTCGEQPECGSQTAVQTGP